MFDSRSCSKPIRTALVVLSALSVGFPFFASAREKECIIAASKSATSLPMREAIERQIGPHSISKSEYETTSEFKNRYDKITSDSNDIMKRLFGENEVAIRVTIDRSTTSYNADKKQLLISNPFRIESIKSQFTKNIVYYVQTEHYQTDKFQDLSRDSKILFFDKYFLGVSMPQDIAKKLGEPFSIPMVPSIAMDYRGSLELLIYGKVRNPYIALKVESVPVFNYSRSGSQVRSLVKAVATIPSPTCIAIVSGKIVLYSF